VADGGWPRASVPHLNSCCSKGEMRGVRGSLVARWGSRPGRGLALPYRCRSLTAAVRGDAGRPRLARGASGGFAARTRSAIHRMFEGECRASEAHSCTLGVAPAELPLGYQHRRGAVRGGSARRAIHGRCPGPVRCPGVVRRPSLRCVRGVAAAPPCAPRRRPLYLGAGASIVLDNPAGNRGGSIRFPPAALWVRAREAGRGRSRGDE